MKKHSTNFYQELINYHENLGKQKYAAINSSNLRSVEKRLEQMAFLEEQLKSQCENLQQSETDLGNEIAEHRVRNEEQTQQYLDTSIDYVKLDKEYSLALKSVADNSIERLNTKLSAKDADLIMSILSDRPDQMKGSGDGETYGM
ncbi:hypothetical protein OSTOST_03559, partial [Ostertagia ostertagi]